VLGTTADLAALGRTLERAFAEFGAPIELEGAPTVGPAFIRFLAKPRRGVTVRALTRLGESVWMRLRTSAPPHVSLERGRVAIDVERPDRQPVAFARWRHALPGRERGGCSRFAVGVTVAGELHLADLSRPESAHFLVAGTSGSGKSEWLRATLASLLTSNTPATLRLALIDPKRSAFAALAGSPYLWRPIVYSEGVEALLDDLVDEMERRYETLGRAGVDHLAEYYARAGTVLPRLVCVCDEYADLLLADRRQRELVEGRIARLGAKARAAGVHLVFATQRPSRDVVKGVIDANFSGRVALKVVRPIESRIILDETGAETLLGRGDLLFRDIGSPVRLQGLLVSRDELETLASGGRA
jgi:DNA segregation ATPase FtsK/SpoIIIE-like protein